MQFVGGLITKRITFSSNIVVKNITVFKHKELTPKNRDITFVIIVFVKANCGSLDPSVFCVLGVSVKGQRDIVQH